MPRRSRLSAYSAQTLGPSPAPPARAGSFFGAIEPFAQASLNDRLLHADLPLVVGQRFWGSCATVVIEGEAINVCFEEAGERASDGILAGRYRLSEELKA